MAAFVSFVLSVVLINEPLHLSNSGATRCTSLKALDQRNDPIQRLRRKKISELKL